MSSYELMIGKLIMYIVDKIKETLHTQGMSHTPAVDLEKLNSSLDFNLDDDIRLLLSEIGFVKRPNGFNIYGYDSVPEEGDIFSQYIKYKDSKRFYPSNSLPILKMTSSRLMVYDCTARRCMLIDIGDEGEILHTFDGGLLEITLEVLKQG